VERAKQDAVFLVTYGSDYLRDYFRDLNQLHQRIWGTSVSDLRAVDNMLAEEYYSVVDAWIANKDAEAKAYEEAGKKMK